MTELENPEAYVRSIGGVPIDEAAEPMDHMTETYVPEEEGSSDGSSDEQE
jgi:hypothetical protein